MKAHTGLRALLCSPGSSGARQSCGLPIGMNGRAQRCSPSCVAMTWEKRESSKDLETSNDMIKLLTNKSC